VLQQLRVILAAEAEARQQVEAARAEGARIVAEAEEAARNAVGAARDEREAVARAVEEGMVAAAQEQAEQLASVMHSPRS